MVFLMVFRQGTRYFLKCSIKRNSRAFVFFMELPPPLAQPPLSHHNHHYHPPLSPPQPITTTTTDESFNFHIFHVHFCWGKSCTKASFSHLLRSFLREVSHESFIFTSSTFNFWGKFCAKASFSHLPLQFQQLIQETSEPCHVLRLLAALGGATRAKNNSFSMGRVWQIGIMWFFGYRFRCRSGYRLGHLVGSRKSAKQWFWETLLFKFLNAAWTKPEAAAENESTNSKRNRGKSGIYSTHAVPAARPQGETLRQSSSFLPPAWRVVTN